MPAQVKNINKLPNEIAGEVLSYLDLRTVLAFSKTSRESKKDYTFFLDVLAQPTLEKIDVFSEITLSKSNSISVGKEIGHYINIMFWMHKKKIISNKDRLACNAQIKVIRERAEKFVNEHMQAEITDLFKLIEGNNTDKAITQIKDNPLLVFGTNDLNETAVHIVVKKGHLDVLWLLKDFGADFDKSDKSGWTPTHIAAQKQNLEMIMLLKKLGADINKSNKYGCIPIHIVVLGGNVRVLSALTVLGADLNKANKYGKTPAHIAAQNAYGEVFNLLAKSGAKLDKADNDGRTPLMIAQSNAHFTAMAFFNNLESEPPKKEQEDHLPMLY